MPRPTREVVPQPTREVVRRQQGRCTRLAAPRARIPRSRRVRDHPPRRCFCFRSLQSPRPRHVRHFPASFGFGTRWHDTSVQPGSRSALSAPPWQRPFRRPLVEGHDHGLLGRTDGLRFRRQSDAGQPSVARVERPEQLRDALEQLEVSSWLSRPHRARDWPSDPLPGYLITPRWAR